MILDFRRPLILLAVVGFSFAPCAFAETSDSSLLEAGFRGMYELHFDQARQIFAQYQQEHPEDSLGKAAEAASYLFEELNNKDVLSSEFFLNDKKLLVGIDGKPDRSLCDPFLEANHSARRMAQEKLKENPRDPHALFVAAIADGMESDYEAILAKRPLASLGFVKRAEEEANKLIATNSQADDAYDAYVAVGTGNYIIGSLPSYKRAFLWFDGIHGDKQRGMQQVAQTAEHGHYLQPFAKILLALASEREHQVVRARDLLADLAKEFPENPLFARELAIAEKLQPKTCCEVQPVQP